MPCFGDAWDDGLTPGTPEYIEEESRVRAELEALLHVVDYYCKAYERELPADFRYGGRNFEDLPIEDKRLLAAIYHHLRCDGINAAAMHDILALVETSDEKCGHVSTIVQTCFMLSRSRPSIKNHTY